MSYRISTSIFSILFVVSSFTVCYANESDYKPDEIIVRFAQKEDKTKFKKHEKNEILSAKNCGYIKKEFKRLSDIAVVKLPKGRDVKDAIEDLKQSKNILYVEPNYKIKLYSIPNDPMFEDLWGLHNTGQSFPDEYGRMIPGTPDADIDAPEAWDIYTGNQNIIVAVLDTGIDYNHPDLAANMWVNQAELVGDPNIDDDGNG